MPADTDRLAQVEAAYEAEQAQIKAAREAERAQIKAAREAEQRIKAAETDRMRLIDAELRKRANVSFRDYLTEAWDEGKGHSWDRITSDLRLQLEGTPYDATPRETVIQYALRYGVIAERPKGMARVRRRPTP